MACICRPQELFTLDLLAGQLVGFHPPQGAFDPAGDWQHTYRFCTLGAIKGIGSRVGTLRIERRRGVAGRFTMRIACRKRTVRQHSAMLTAQIEARSGPLPRPLHWSWQSRIIDGAGVAMPFSRIERSASLEGPTVAFSGGRPSLAVDGPCTINWLLLEAAGRLPRTQFPPLAFTLLDDFDRPKPGQTLRYGHSSTVLLGAPVPLHAYYQLGRGIVPWVYWVDDQGRLLFAVSGIEAYVLDSFAGEQPKKT